MTIGHTLKVIEAYTRHVGRGVPRPIQLGLTNFCSDNCQEEQDQNDKG